MADIIGREKEKEILEEIYESTEAQLLAIYGRRRVGKTHLIREFFYDKGFYFQVTGVSKGTIHDQLFHFREEISAKFYHGEPCPSSPKSWMEALSLLRREVDKLSSERKIILFFDEFPWLATKKSRFLGAFEHFWNQYMVTRSNVIVVVCGSAASWMIKHVINNKGGLYGRLTRKIRLLPLSLSSTENFLIARDVQLERKQIVELYMAMGGIPQYLKCAKRGKSAVQIINNCCFHSNGPLFDEFSNLFRSLFRHHENHIAIVRALAKKLSGMTKTDLLKATGLVSGGHSSKIIKELEESGFIRYIPPFGDKKTGGKYQLIDEYSLFYLIWIENTKGMRMEEEESDYWILQHESRKRKWSVWSGYAFEMICLKHLSNIKKALGISGIRTTESGWYTRGEEGAQIDLVIDRADKCINLCEVKFYNGEYIISEDYAKRLEKKKQIFREQTRTRKTLFITLITPYGAQKNRHYLSAVDNQLTMDILFSRS